MKNSKYIQNIFSVKNVNTHKIITFLGLKLKFKSEKLLNRIKYQQLEMQFQELKQQHKEIIDKHRKEVSNG